MKDEGYIRCHYFKSLNDLEREINEEKAKEKKAMNNKNKETRNKADISLKERKEIYDMKLAGVSDKDIMKEYNISSGMLFRIRKAYDGDPKYASYLTDEPVAKTKKEKKIEKKAEVNKAVKQVNELKLEIQNATELKVENKTTLSPSSVAEWLMSKCSDAEFVQTFAIISRNQLALRGFDYQLRETDVSEMNVDILTSKINNELKVLMK